MPDEQPDTRLYLTFVCTGNICRSPMGQNIFRKAIADAGLADRVRIDSCGTGNWHVGHPADPRARAELLAAGYSDEHVAAQIGPAHLEADLAIAMDWGHERQLKMFGIERRTRLLRSFDPDAGHYLDVDDPYHGGPEEFRRVRLEVEAAVPGLLDWVRARLDGPGSAGE